MTIVPITNIVTKNEDKITSIFGKSKYFIGRKATDKNSSRYLDFNNYFCTKSKTHKEKHTHFSQFLTVGNQNIPTETQPKNIATVIS